MRPAAGPARFRLLPKPTAARPTSPDPDHARDVAALQGSKFIAFKTRKLKMPKVKLDHAFSLTAQCESGRRKTDYWDVIVSGFVLEARSSGGKTYYLRYFDPAGR